MGARTCRGAFLCCVTLKYPLNPIFCLPCVPCLPLYLLPFLCCVPLKSIPYTVLCPPCYIGRVPYRDPDEHRKANRERMRRKRAAARAAGGASVPTSARKALAGKLKRAAASLKATTPITKRAKKKSKPVKKTAKKPAKKKVAKKKRATKRAKVVGRITPKVKAKAPPPGPPGRSNPGDIVRAALDNAADIVLRGQPFTLHDSKQAIGIVRDALETIAVVDSHRPPAQVEAELSQFVQVALDFVPQKRREDFYKEFQKALKAAT